MDKLFDAKTRRAMIAAVTEPRDMRSKLGLNQSVFWNQFGVTQSGGSRYESGRNMAGPLQLLLALQAAGKFSTDELMAVQDVLGATFKSSAE